MSINLVLINTINGTEMWCVPTTIISVLRPWITYARLELTDEDLRFMLSKKLNKGVNRGDDAPVFLDLSASTLFVRLQSLKSDQLDRVDMQLVHDVCVANWKHCHQIRTPENLV